MQPNNEKLTKFLLAAEGVGVFFVIVYSAAYLLGLPSTNVLHSEPAIRVTLSVLGLVLVALALAALVAAWLWKRRE